MGKVGAGGGCRGLATLASATLAAAFLLGLGFGSALEHTGDGGEKIPLLLGQLLLDHFRQGFRIGRGELFRHGGFFGALDHLLELMVELGAGFAIVYMLIERTGVVAVELLIESLLNQVSILAAIHHILYQLGLRGLLILDPNTLRFALEL